jgi:quinohemoprotein ethanol dehydrogenase
MLGSTRADGAYSTLQAWNPVRQELVWEVPQPGKFSPGTLTTAGNLVFQGRVDGTFIAYAADTGEELWHLPLGLGISAPPISYSVDGRQYIALLVGWGGALAGLGGAPVAEYGWAYGAQTRMLVAFSLEGTATLPPRAEPVIPTPVEAEFDVVPRLAEAGATTFGRCGDCHGPDAISAGMAPDLRASLLIQSPEAFAEVVRDGSRAANGMPIFPELTDDELLELRNYIRQQAELGLAEVGGAGSE